MSVKEKNCVSCFKILAEPTRISLIKYLQSGSYNVTEITKYLGVTQPTVSHHLKLLDKLGMVTKEPRGRKVVYGYNQDYPCRGCGVFTLPIKT
ncbi:MAG: metalloregulator ArsR/SmtB family transcription factor [bacterium]|nr:metalloregulator ArsR/SmtB family transcription factor [bacterium]